MCVFCCVHMVCLCAFCCVDMQLSRRSSAMTCVLVICVHVVSAYLVVYICNFWERVLRWCAFFLCVRIGCIRQNRNCSAMACVRVFVVYVYSTWERLLAWCVLLLSTCVIWHVYMHHICNTELVYDGVCVCLVMYLWFVCLFCCVHM